MSVTYSLIKQRSFVIWKEKRKLFKIVKFQNFGIIGMNLDNFCTNFDFLARICFTNFNKKLANFCNNWAFCATNWVIFGRPQFGNIW